MSLKKHLAMALVVFFLWAAFYAGGLLSDYYTRWNDAEKILLVTVTGFAIVPFTAFLVGVFWNQDYLKTCLWLGFYGSVGIFLLDFIVVGILEGKGLGFLLSHWPQSIGYLEALIFGPPVGAAMKKFKQTPIVK